MEKKYVFLDLDDTLVETQPLYDKTKRKLVEYFLILFSGLDSEELKEVFKRIDKENVKEYGFSPKRFPKSWADTYRYYLEKYGMEENQETKKIIENMANEVFSNIAPLYPETMDVLRELAKMNVEMNLLTAGDEEIQQKRIKDAGIHSSFDNVYIVPLKTPESMKEVMQGIEANKCIMVGNSLKSDIYPSLELGLNAVHIERKTWDYDRYEIDYENSRYHVSTLKNLPNTLKNILNRL